MASAAAATATAHRVLLRRCRPGGDRRRGLRSTSSCYYNRSAVRFFSSVEDDSRRTTGTAAAASAVAPASSTAPAEDGTAASSAVPVPSAAPSRVVAYLDLAKARLSALVVTTTAAGFVAAGGPISTQWDVFGACVAGTALCASSAAALNQVVERNQDSKMRRTAQRPLVTGLLTPVQATTAATAWGVAGTSVLYMGCDPLTAALGLGNVALYAGLYTAMKPRSVYNTWVGAVVGAIPPVMGYSAATGGSILDLQPLLLASTLYLWQMPHFFALSYMYRADYKRGGFQMVPCLEEDGVETARLVVRYAWFLSAVPVVATVAGATSSMFALEGIVLNVYFLTQAHKFQRERTNANARKVFLTSLWYLPSLLMLYLLHSKVWDEEDEETKNDVVAKWLSDTIHGIRSRGSQLCPHEVVAAAKAVDGSGIGGGGEACPVTIANRKGGRGVGIASDAVARAVTATTTASTANATLTVSTDTTTATTDTDDATAANREV